MSVNVPKIVNDGLVFGYDSNSGSKFSPGPPGVNKVTNVGFTYGNRTDTYFKMAYNTHSVTIPKVGKRTSYSVATYNDYGGGSGVCCQQLFNLGGGSVTPGTICTYQIIYRINDGYTHPNLMYHYEYGPGGYLTEGGLHSDGNREYLGDGWYHAWNQFTLNGSATSVTLYCYIYQYATYNRFEIGGIQFTNGNAIFKPSQFLGLGQNRSNTASLLDLKGNRTIDVGGITLNTNGVSYFDGTNDFMDLGGLYTMSSGAYTIDVVFNCYKMPSGTAASDIQNFIGDSSYSQNAHFFSVRAKRIAFWNLNTTGGGAAVNWYSSNTDLTVNTSYHVSFVCDNGYYYIYVNGVLDSSLPFMGITDNSLTIRYIGKFMNERYFYGEIPLLKCYNRVLTATEIKNNYNSYKSRYNIA